MAQNPNSTQQSTQPTQPSTGNKHIILYVIAGLVIILIIAAIWLFSTSPSYTQYTITQNQSQNLTRIYISPSQAQLLLGTSLSNYNVSDVYNPYALYNISLLTEIAPVLYGNVTSGWITTAIGGNATTNSSIAYFELASSNTSAVARSFGASLVSYVNMTPTTVNSGAQDGLNYTYGVYQNSTLTVQLLYGWKNSHIVAALIEENPGFLVNQTQLVGIAANVTP